ncbi:MAG: methionyl-tRNA formyltransferase [Clostridiales bacterium]|nr:methionyl-tRNA formyltransferase [Clostridiales bacterium]
MKILFLGTPQFAATSLEALLKSAHTVVGVVTQPDRALKHGKTELSPVKQLALSAGLTVYQPQKIRADIDALKAFGADIAVTAAYGQILDSGVLNAFKYGVINVHASLLPKYRGASPIQSAIAAGERVTGVTIMRTELGIDTGDILGTATTEIGENETAGELTVRLAELGAELLVRTLDNFSAVTPIKQDDSIATHCKMISKSEQIIDFSADCNDVVNRIRALSPNPCAKTFIDGEQYKIFRASVCNEQLSGVVGQVVCTKDQMYIKCGNGGICVDTIQAPSKRAMPIADFLRGKKFREDVVCAKQP